MTLTTEQNQVEADIIDDTSHNSDGARLVTIDELQDILNNRPLNLLEKALEKIDSNQAKLRSLYRSQLFVESEYRNSDLGVADGSDCELIQVINDELKELKAIISKAITQLESE
ncbi:hypothetical protein H6F42_21585 [Pseudanabaena sp. FACHB-1998]|uniref:hypothetical protein n=1 Tax=Pseudanabaena sp. FACHB-1998 TaxID=2692858 RepID=UPI001680F516|nr:hypothetical protein [Pseudanabaena sp. FACHB-1998]MBD2179509.1 hypothetical protein [Pseudanabaena sp. FACHB-1998]